MHLSNITIKNFRGIRHMQVAFHQTLNVIIGENSSHKTALIDSIRLLYDLFEPQRSIFVNNEDFHYDPDDEPAPAKTIEFIYEFRGLSAAQQRALYECMVYEPSTQDHHARISLKYHYRQEQSPRLVYATGHSEDNRADRESFQWFRHYYLSALRDSVRAKPNLFVDKFEQAKKQDGWTAIEFPICYRSPQNMIDLYSPLRKRGSTPINSSHEGEPKHPIYIFKYKWKQGAQSLIDKYKEVYTRYGYTKNHIVVKGKKFLETFFEINTLKPDDKSLPWRKSYAFELAKLRIALDQQKFKTAIDDFYTMIDLHWSDAGLVVSQEGMSLYDRKKQLFDIIKGMPATNLTVKDWTAKTETYLREKLGHLTIDLGFKEGVANGLKEQVDDWVPSFDSEIPITTIHQVKGMSLDSILVVFDDAFSLDRNYKTNPSRFPHENQRVLYVALSRPSYLLALAVPDTVSNEDIRKKLNTGSDISLEFVETF